MSGFSTDWLTLRAAADARARSADLIARAARHIEATGGACRVVDLGAGTGATLRALTEHLPRPQSWTLVDADPGLLAEAERRSHGLEGVTMETRALDLVAAPVPWDEPPDLVTASALFDIGSAAFIARLAESLAAAQVPLLAMLTYDGRIALSPSHPLDAAMIDAFNAHQRGLKSFGKAAGPDAVPLLEAALRKHGFDVELRDTPWRLERATDGALIDATLDGWAGAAAEILPDRSEAIAQWRAARIGTTERLMIGHTDILALPQR
ncbi:class I SAM-dependent methyltransferase [Acuticoccus sp. M5D2P5]|uniref:class I SAM-dependent methyltransferase n=1 Tax=Acuticoccus kalidii TaxID=2910977 RepID=UPI001F45DE78|nr:class I SAM-dependent methyltransferase [Acuticoccus kalidii]MCF3932076.1 class I SAM-dependent methyltransferase [Acuticoccus kalidii]